jgi:hypothetical protein
MWKPVEASNRTPKQRRIAIWTAVTSAFLSGLLTDNLLTGHAANRIFLVLSLGYALFSTIQSAFAAIPRTE